MNIFPLDRDPVVAAQCLCDKHVPALHREIGVIMSLSFPINPDPNLWCRKGEKSSGLYNMKLARWCRTTDSNWVWALSHMQAIIQEHCFRWKYDRPWFKSQEIWQWLLLHSSELNIPDGPLTPFALSITSSMIPEIPPQTVDDSIELYRLYYIRYKSSIATWNRGRPAPEWFLEGLKREKPT
jgi:hypothetical protein